MGTGMHRPGERRMLQALPWAHLVFLPAPCILYPGWEVLCLITGEEMCPGRSRLTKWRAGSRPQSACPQCILFLPDSAVWVSVVTTPLLPGPSQFLETGSNLPPTPPRPPDQVKTVAMETIMTVTLAVAFISLLVPRF